MGVPVNDRLPGYGRYLSIDSSYLLFYLLFSFGVSLNIVTRRNYVQDEHYFFAPLGVMIEEMLEGIQAVHQTLGIIEPVNREDDLFAFEIISYLGPVLSCFRIVACFVEFLIIDAYGEQIGFDEP